MKRPITTRRRRRNLRKPINVLASGLTTLNLYFGIAAIFATIQQDFPKAAYFILVAIILDTLDGTVARLTRSTSDFGKQLDSLADMVSFGVAPAVMIYTAYLPEEPTNVTRLGAVLAIFYVISAALRLARFNVYQADMRDYFVGLPSPAAAGTLASFVLFAQYFAWDEVMWYILGPLTVALSLLMVSRMVYPKARAKSLLYGPRKAFSFLVLVGIAIAVLDQASHLSPSIVLLPVALLYVASGFVETIYLRSQRARKGPNLPQGSIARTPQPPHTPESPGPSYTGDRL